VEPLGAVGASPFTDLLRLSASAQNSADTLNAPAKAGRGGIEGVRYFLEGHLRKLAVPGLMILDCPASLAMT